MNISAKPRILWMSDSPTAITGFGTVTREVLRRLVDRGYEVAALGWGYQGWPYDKEAIPYSIYPSTGQPLGRDAFGRALGDFCPDVVVSLSDPWMVEWLRPARDLSVFRWIGYFVIDGAPMPSQWRRTLRATDMVVGCSRFGQETMTAACPELDVAMIPHGADLATFRPLPGRDTLRREQGLDKKFVIGCVARNQPRKRYPILLEAFARFRQRRNDAFLYLHTDPDDVGWDLRALIRRYGITDCTAVSRKATVDRGELPDRLNEIYNLFDVFVLPTASEGFGLPIIEAMAAGVPVAVTAHSACVELVEGRGELIPSKASLTVGRYGVDQALPDTDAIVDILERLYQDPALRRAHRQAGLAHARHFDWEPIVDQWEHAVTDLHQRAWTPTPTPTSSTPTPTSSTPSTQTQTQIHTAADEQEPPASLFVVGLPRSMTTVCYHLARRALGLRQPSWTSDGEVLNAERFMLAGKAFKSTTHFLRVGSPNHFFERGCHFLEELVQPQGFAYKDVVQPFMIAQWLQGRDTKVLKITRPVEDVAWSMLMQGWDYPAAPNERDWQSDNDSDARPRAVIRGLLDAEQALAEVDGEVLSWKTLVTEERALEAGLRRLYPASDIRAVRFHDAAFLKTRDQIIARRQRRDFGKLRELVQECRNAEE